LRISSSNTPVFIPNKSCSQNLLSLAIDISAANGASLSGTVYRIMLLFLCCCFYKPSYPALPLLHPWSHAKLFALSALCMSAATPQLRIRMFKQQHQQHVYQRPLPSSRGFFTLLGKIYHRQAFTSFLQCLNHRTWNCQSRINSKLHTVGRSSGLELIR